MSATKCIKMIVSVNSIEHERLYSHSEKPLIEFDIPFSFPTFSS